jgi:hypothetical protein
VACSLQHSTKYSGSKEVSNLLTSLIKLVSQERLWFVEFLIHINKLSVGTICIWHRTGLCN